MRIVSYCCSGERSVFGYKERGNLEMIGEERERASERYIEFGKQGKIKNES